MAILAMIKLGDEFWRLVLDTSYMGAVDLRFRYKEVHSWFAGIPVYSEISKAVYPPASYVILWPFLGWLDLTPARWLWAATTIIALVYLVYLVVKESGATTTLEKVFAALIPLSMNATGSGIGNGQPVLYQITALLVGILLLRKRRAGWFSDILGALLMLMALVKPSISAPFFWIVIFVPGRLRPAFLVILGYIALTLFSASFQEAGLLTLIHDWLALSSSVSVRDGYANLNIWLTTLGLEEWSLLVSLLALLSLGVWTYFYRRVDLWLLLGVSALVARFWTHHRWYDDLLILIPIITLFRITKREPSANGSDAIAGVLLAITVLSMLAPYRVQNLPSPWYLLFTGGHALIWVLTLIFLLYQAWREKRHGVLLTNSSSSYTVGLST
jgi:hypothetical protein